MYRIHRILLFVTMFFLPVLLMAQLPENVRVEKIHSYTEFEKRLNSNNAGTIQSRTLVGNAQSNDVQFLCFGDSLQVLHNQDFDLSQDPDPSTMPGIGYAIYSCPPTIDGMDISTVITDPCLVTDPMPMNDLWAVTDEANGNAIFNNILFQPGNITVMDFYNNGDPIRLYYAPITFDDFDNNTYENGGPCVNVSVAEAFSLVYLNPVELSFNDDQLGCNCDGMLELNFSGGLPEYDPSQAYVLSITERSTGNVIVSGENVQAGNNYMLNLPNSGEYEILVEDGVSCEYFSIEEFCTDKIELDIPEVNADPGDVVCLPVTVNCLDSFLVIQFELSFDDAVLRFDTIYSDIIDINGSSYNLFSNDQLILTWDNPNLNSTPVMDGDTLLYICFEVIGNSGGSDVILRDVEIASSGNQVFRDADGGILIDQGRVNITGQSLQIIDTLIQDIITCPDDTTGSINITVAGGRAPYQFLWQTPTGSSTNEDLFNIVAGNYTVTIRDSEVPPNELIANFVVDAPSDFSIDLQGVDPLCFDSLNGCLIINNIAGGTPPYSWTWQDVQGDPVGTPNQDSVCGVGRGLYTLEITDANGCQTTDRLVLQANPITVILDMDASVLRESCSPGMDGQLAINIQGGDISQSGQHSIEWSTGDRNVTQVSNLASGNYSVTVTDDNGCSVVRTGLFISPARAPFVTTIDSVSISCPGGSDGILIARFASPGSPIDQIEWSTGDVAGPGTMIDSITGLSRGWYYVTVTSADGCQGVDSAFLGDPPGISYNVLIEEEDCFGDNSGSIQIIPRPNADTSDVLVSWSNGEAGYRIDSLPPGNYTAYFTDTIVGCVIDSFSTRLRTGSRMIFSFSNTSPASCFNVCDGAASLTVMGGNAPNGAYDITWSNNQVDGNTNTSTNTRLCAGMNYVTVIDEAGCQLVDSIEIASPPELNLNLMETELISPSCTGFSDGEIRLSIEGGQAPYTAIWINGFEGVERTNLAAGNYPITIQDGNGCLSTATLQLEEPDSFFVFVDISSSNLALDCNEDSDGRVVISSSTVGGNGLTYVWSPNVSNSFEAVNLRPGSYDVTVTNSNGCSDVASANVSGVPEVVFDLSGIEQPACFGDPSTFTVSSVSGGNGGPYSYKVLEENLEFDIGDSVSLFAGTYTLAIVDRDGCETDTVITIGQPQELLVNIPHDTIIRGQELLLAEMGEDKSIIVQYTPLTTVLGNVRWQFDDPVGSERYNRDSTRITTQFLSSQLVSVEIVDENGCVGSDEVFLRVDRDRNVYIPNAFSPNADNINDLFAVYTGVGVRNIKSFRVFDRWGEQVYFVENIDPLVFNSNAVGWDGRLNGKELNPAVFVYLIEVEFIDGEVLLYRGDVTLVK